jgi:hypothetical protein
MTTYGARRLHPDVVRQRWRSFRRAGGSAVDLGEVRRYLAVLADYVAAQDDEIKWLREENERFRRSQTEQAERDAQRLVRPYLDTGDMPAPPVATPTSPPNLGGHHGPANAEHYPNVAVYPWYG